MILIYFLKRKNTKSDPGKGYGHLMQRLACLIWFHRSQTAEEMMTGYNRKVSEHTAYIATARVLSGPSLKPVWLFSLNNKVFLSPKPPLTFFILYYTFYKLLCMEIQGPKQFLKHLIQPVWHQPSCYIKISEITFFPFRWLNITWRFWPISAHYTYTHCADHKHRLFGYKQKSMQRFS